MKHINENDIHNLNGIIVELPAFRDLKTKDAIHKILDEFLKSVYVDGLKDISDTFEFNLSEKMQEVFFTNYGIDKSYSRKIKGRLKKDLAYRLERLFQNKGSRTIFRLFADTFKDVFRHLNFYNIKVHKIPYVYDNKDNFLYEYRLEPLYITDEANLLEKPNTDIKISRKFLMSLDDFKKYTFWPIPTNLVYIQFSIGPEIINNFETFFNGVRSYANTYLAGGIIEYKDRFGVNEIIHLADIELIVNYLILEQIHRRNPDNDLALETARGSYLSFFEDHDFLPDPNNPNYEKFMLWQKDSDTFLLNMQDLIESYSKANRVSRKDMENLRRRWQFFLSASERVETCYLNYNELYDYMTAKYPKITSDFNYFLDKAINDGEKENLFEFYLNLHNFFINGAYSNPRNPALDLRTDWVFEYIDVIFSALFLSDEFLNFYFRPVMDLFIRYFFPIEMEYLVDFMKGIYIKDKWNAFNYEENIGIEVRKRNFSTQIYGLDYKKFRMDLNKRHSYVDELDKAGVLFYHQNETKYNDLLDAIKMTPRRKHRDRLTLEDSFDVEIISTGGILAGDTKNSTKVKISKTCFDLSKIAGIAGAQNNSQTDINLTKRHIGLIFNKLRETIAKK